MSARSLVLSEKRTSSGPVISNIYFRSASSTTYASRTNTVITAPPSIVNGDILIVDIIVAVSGTPTIPTAPAGFTQIATSTIPGASGFNANKSVWWKRAASESGSYTFTHATYSSQAVMKVYGGCLSSGTPVGANSQASGTGTTTTATGITTGAPYSWLLFESNNWTAQTPLAPPTGFIEEFIGLLYSAEAIANTAGSTGNVVLSPNQNNTGTDAWSVHLVELFNSTTPYTGNIAFRSLVSTTYASRVNTTLTAPTGLADNDIMVMTLLVAFGGTPPVPTPPTGWTEFGTATDIVGSSEANLRIYWKRAASESGSYTWTHTSANTQGVLKAYSGCIISGTPLGATANNSGLSANAAAGTNYTSVSSITTTAANSYLLFESHDGQGIGTLIPSPGMTTRFNGLVFSADQPLSLGVSAATGPRKMLNGNSATIDPWAVRMIELLSG